MHEFSVDFRSLGVRQVINCMGPVTILGGARMLPECVQAMQSAANARFDLIELQAVIGKRIAQLAGCPAAYVTTGAAAGVELAVAACVAGVDPSRIVRLPDARFMPHRVVISRKQRNNFDHAVRNAGITLIEYGWRKGYTEPWELAEVLNDTTAAIVVFDSLQTESDLPLSTVSGIAHERHIPVVLDAAEAMPPISNLQDLYAKGADLICVSGGKNLRGPQASGLVVGRSDLISACAANGSPFPNTLGRPMKVSKDAMLGLLAACEAWTEESVALERQSWERRSLRIVDLLKERPGIQPTIETAFDHGQAGTLVRVEVSSSEGDAMLARKLADRLAEGDPSIRVSARGNSVMIDPRELGDDEADVVAGQILQAVAPSPGSQEAE